MTVLLHINRFDADADLLQAIKISMTNTALTSVLAERKSLEFVTYTEQTKTYKWWTGYGPRLMGPVPFPIKYLRISNLDFKTFTLDHDDEVYLAYDYIFTKHSVSFPFFDDTDNESISVDMLSSAVLSLIKKDNVSSAYMYINAYQVMRSLMAETFEEKPDYKQEKNITRGIKPFTLPGGLQ